ncbi:ATP-grasp domain-containing protein [Desulfolithobacter dissulfuricans]|uniref:ATP-grasp domain-containing protein n=1 Tax=Desulfolithobacter dissulfuricans TaxID=2795293 RepID=UPI0022789DE2|nr:glutathione synthase [Desulfolithobacter dissulfuricans]
MERDRKRKGVVLSFHPTLPGDRFIWERGSLGPGELEWVREARAVLLPQTVARELYYLVRYHCPAVFPNYDLRFRWEGKVGDTMLFWSLGVPHPETRIYPRVEALEHDHPAMDYTAIQPLYPCVVKASSGGEGSHTWLVRSRDELAEVVHRLKELENEGYHGFVIQEYVGRVERDLRVVIIGDQVLSYWRINPGFYKNVARGGEIDPESDPELQAIGREQVARLCERTGINLAGFDLIFPREAISPFFWRSTIPLAARDWTAAGATRNCWRRR